MNPNFAKGPCPVCGETAEWLVDKNCIACSYCPNNHLVWLGNVGDYEFSIVIKKKGAE